MNITEEDVFAYVFQRTLLSREKADYIRKNKFDYLIWIKFLKASFRLSHAPVKRSLFTRASNKPLK